MIGMPLSTTDHLYLNLPGELDVVTDIQVNAEVKELSHTLVIPAMREIRHLKEQQREITEQIAASSTHIGCKPSITRILGGSISSGGSSNPETWL